MPIGYEGSDVPVICVIATKHILIDIAHKAGACPALIAAQADVRLASEGGVLAVIPAQTMTDDAKRPPWLRSRADAETNRHDRARN